MKRNEFSKATKLIAWERCKGMCELCGLKIIGVAEYDHIIPCGLGGANDVHNCRCVCRKCHGKKTSEQDVPMISKAVRIAEKRNGVRRTKNPLPGSKASRWKRRMDGTVERR